jgi:hypothetical protein
MQPYATSVCGLKLLVYAALSARGTELQLPGRLLVYVLLYLLLYSLLYLLLACHYTLTGELTEIMKPVQDKGKISTGVCVCVCLRARARNIWACDGKWLVSAVACFSSLSSCACACVCV